MPFQSLKKSIRSIAVSCAAAVTLSACDAGLTLGTQSRTDILPVVTIPGARVPDELELSVRLSLASPELELGAGSNIVSSVRVRNLRLVILDLSEISGVEDGALDSFDFLSSIEVSIRADFNGRTNQKLIAVLPDGDPQIGTAARSLTLTVVNNDSDVLDFLLAPGGYDVVLGLGGNIPADDVVLSGEIRYRLGLGF